MYCRKHNTKMVLSCGDEPYATPCFECPKCAAEKVAAEILKDFRESIYAEGRDFVVGGDE